MGGRRASVGGARRRTCYSIVEYLRERRAEAAHKLAGVELEQFLVAAAERLLLLLLLLLELPLYRC